MSFYIMVDNECENELGEALFEIHNCFEVGDIMSWSGGGVITEKITSPIRIDFEPLKGDAGPNLDVWDDCIPLMSIRLGSALQDSGIDNLQLFPAILRNTKTNKAMIIMLSTLLV
jgi:hypothetical protein